MFKALHSLKDKYSSDLSDFVNVSACKASFHALQLIAPGNAIENGMLDGFLASDSKPGCLKDRFQAICLPC